jgi:hypothetical protein
MKLVFSLFSCALIVRNSFAVSSSSMLYLLKHIQMIPLHGFPSSGTRSLGLVLVVTSY